MTKNAFSQTEIDAVYRAIYERRDMRHFIKGDVPTDVITRLLNAAHHAPSVGLMQPWRFIRITNERIREEIYALVQAERLRTSEAFATQENIERMHEFLRLKVEGILECGELLVVTLCDKRDGHIFGRRTMPEMDLASVSCAIQNMWLAARAEGYGMGWVSMFEPEALAELLRIPSDAKPIAVLCIGHVDAFYQAPMLVEERWATEKPLNEMLMENHWQVKEQDKEHQS
jgi:5,6-dimethylbenzimidazole synthase